jgi:hypothetical protein
MRMARRDKDDLQWQHPAFSRLPILEHLIDAAAQLLLYALNAARLQRHTGRRRFVRPKIEHRERRAQDGGAPQRDRDQLSHEKMRISHNGHQGAQRVKDSGNEPLSVVSFV